MSTKQNPSPNDCYNRAEPDEPLFTLLARDPLAPGVVRLWAALRAHDTTRAAGIFANLCVTTSKQPYKPGKDSDHVIEARECSNAMELWRRVHNPRPQDVRAIAASFDLEALAQGKADHEHEA